MSLDGPLSLQHLTEKAELLIRIANNIGGERLATPPPVSPLPSSDVHRPDRTSGARDSGRVEQSPEPWPEPDDPSFSSRPDAPRRLLSATLFGLRAPVLPPSAERDGVASLNRFSTSFNAGGDITAAAPGVEDTAFAALVRAVTAAMVSPSSEGRLALSPQEAAAASQDKEANPWSRSPDANGTKGLPTAVTRVPEPFTRTHDPSDGAHAALSNGTRPAEDVALSAQPPHEAVSLALGAEVDPVQGPPALERTGDRTATTKSPSASATGGLSRDFGSDGRATPPSVWTAEASRPSSPAIPIASRSDPVIAEPQPETAAENTGMILFDRGPSPAVRSPTEGAYPMPFSADGTDLDAATQALQDLGFGGHEPMLPAGTERAGILASFILNAAMIPGWPPPRPIEGVEIKTLQTLLSKNQIVSKGDLELLLYLANIGFSRAHLSKFLKRVEDRKRRSRILRAVALIMTNLVAVVDVMGRELQMLREEASDETRPKGPSHRARIGV